MKLIVTDRVGQTTEIPYEAGSRLMHVLRDADFGICAECDGNYACATCHVY
jgi:ferredoxin